MKIVMLPDNHPSKEQLTALENKGYFLRDDLEIRHRVDIFEGFEQAYSLFKREPLERVHVYAMKLELAIEAAWKQFAQE